jgi:hypothetical protein
MSALKELIRSRIETHAVQHAIVGLLADKYEGKRWNKNIVEELNTLVRSMGCGHLWVRQTASTSYLHWYSHPNSHPECCEMSLFLFGDTKNIRVDTADMRRREPAYFDGASRRNVDRESLLALPSLEAYERKFEAAVAAIVDLMEDLEPVVKLPELEADRRAVLKHYGLDKIFEAWTDSKADLRKSAKKS